jgi:hypothetical protein
MLDAEGRAKGVVKQRMLVIKEAEVDGVERLGWAQAGWKEGEIDRSKVKQWGIGFVVKLSFVGSVARITADDVNATLLDAALGDTARRCLALDFDAGHD